MAEGAHCVGGDPGIFRDRCNCRGLENWVSTSRPPQREGDAIHVGCFTHSNFFHSFGCLLFLDALLRFRSCSSLAAVVGMAGGGRKDATAGRSAAAAADAAADASRGVNAIGRLSVRGRSRGGE